MYLSKIISFFYQIYIKKLIAISFFIDFTSVLTKLFIWLIKAKIVVVKTTKQKQSQFANNFAKKAKNKD